MQNYLAQGNIFFAQNISMFNFTVINHILISLIPCKKATGNARIFIADQQMISSKCYQYNKVTRNASPLLYWKSIKLWHKQSDNANFLRKHKIIQPILVKNNPPNNLIFHFLYAELKFEKGPKTHERLINRLVLFRFPILHAFESIKCMFCNV